MKDLFKAIKATTSNAEDAVLISTLDAENHAKALISNGEVVWCKGDRPFFDRDIRAFETIERNQEMTVDGTTLFCEIVKAEPNLVICGAGHVGIACVKMAKVLGMHVTMLEDRADFAQLALDAGADIAICKSFKEGLADIQYTDSTYFLCMTRAHAFDQDCLEMILPNRFAYVGMLGSPRKVAALRENLEKKGIAPECFARLHSPVGLNIGARTPAEIAVSVMGQIVEHKNVLNKLDLTFTHEIMDCIVGENVPCMLCTLVRNNGGTPRTPGTKMLVYASDDFTGTIGGGAMENQVKLKAAELLKDASVEAEFIHVGIDENEPNSGMSCNGSAWVLIERV